MRTSRADRAAGLAAACALYFAGFDACGASRTGPVATRAIHAQLPITCIVLPNPEPIVTFSIVDGAGVIMIEY